MKISVYKFRFNTMWIFRKLVLFTSRVVAAVPHTTFGEIASMHDGPCQRCVGKGIEVPTES